MRRGAKPAKGKVEAKAPGGRNAQKSADSKVRDLEKRLAESLKREDDTSKRLAEALGQLQARDGELVEAQEQQTATAQVLELIASSPGDLQPTFDGIVQRARQLCDGLFSVLYGVHGELITIEADDHITPENRQLLRSRFPMALNRSQIFRPMFLERRVVHVEDAAADPRFQQIPFRQAVGYRTLLLVPMLREGAVIGAIGVARVEPGGFADKQVRLLQTFADQAVIAIENVRLFTELQEKNRALTQAHEQISEAFERQTATADILGVISRSPTDVQPVFDAIVASATRLCDAGTGAVVSFDGELMHLQATRNWTPEFDAAIRPTLPAPPSRAFSVGRAILERTVVHVPDVELDPEYTVFIRLAGFFRSLLTVPMLRDGVPLGAITVGRAAPGPFADNQIALLKTFADQAVIAIENVRLFNETKEALERQTATSEILRVISSSPTDTQPVFDTIAKSALRLCGAYDSTVFLLDGQNLRLFAHDGPIPSITVLPVVRGTVGGRAVLERQPVHVADVQAEVEEFPEASVKARQYSFRTIVSVPLLREGQAIGILQLRRTEVAAFSDKQIALLQTFADQAVIAIENVRLFKELQSSNSELRVALEQQTATSELLKVIGRSTFDLLPVFETLAENAVRLCEGHQAGIFRFDGQALRVVATHNASPELKAFLERNPIVPGRGSVAGHAALERRTVHVHDVRTDPEYTWGITQIDPIRTVLMIPMLRSGELLGLIGVNRLEVRAFSDNQIALLQTFADQAAIAIENVRLFKELEAANRELAAASQHKSEFLANMSHELRTPLNAIIGFSEVLSERMFGELNEKQEEYSKDIHASGQHLLSLINDILDLSKIEAGRMELELSDFHLPTALDSALILVRERAGRRSIALHLSVDERLGQIQADERKVRQVVLNLLSNAIKFTPEGGRIEVMAAPKDGLVEVSVSDTGVGIAPEDQEAVFEEFRQVGTADKKVEGTGLGLTLCRKFVELHGGRIWVKSQVGQGSVFTFTIPTGK